MSQTENEDRQVVVPVRVVEPLPARGKREILQSRFGQLKVKRQTPLLLLPERPTRVHARLFNNSSTEDLIIASNESVAGFTGTRVPAQKDAEIRGPNPIYGTTDPAAVATFGVSDRALIGTVSRKTVLVGNPAAGADWNAVVPAGEFWDVQSLTATLVTSVTVATREARLEISDGANRIAEIPPSNTQLANVNARYGLNTGGPAGSGPSTTAINWGGPDPLLLSPGFIISTSTLNIQVGDQWSQIAIDVFFSSAATQPASADGIVVSILDEYLVPYDYQMVKKNKR